MWGRRTTRTSDAAVAARRRLAAIAAEFDRSPDPARDSPPTPSSSLRKAPEPPATGSEGSRARHLARASGGGRWRLTAHHLALIAVMVAALVALASWWALQAVPHDDRVPLATAQAPGQLGTASGTSGPVTPELVTPSPGRTPPPPPPPGGGPASNPAAPPLVIDVAGKVRRPGIVELPAGSRVVDALDAAGGARPGVRTAGLNLARPLVDGEQIVVGLEVPTIPAVAAPPGAVSTTTQLSVNVNTAGQPELETLPGIGPVTAQAILDYRAENGAFTSVDQLLDVSGIGDATLADIAPYVHV